MSNQEKPSTDTHSNDHEKKFENFGCQPPDHLQTPQYDATVGCIWICICISSIIMFLLSMYGLYTMINHILN